MKIINYLLSAFAIMAMATACEHDPDEISLSPVDLQITPHKQVWVSENTLSETFTLVWSNVRFASGATSSYTVSVNNDGGEFLPLGETAANSYSTPIASIFETLGIGVGGDYNLNFRVEARSEVDEPVQQTIMIPFKFDKVSYLWVVGDYQGWKPEEGASRLLQDQSGIYKGFVHMPDGGEFKFVSQPSWDGTAYGQGEGEGMLSTEGGNLAAEAGLYYAEVDLEQLSYQLYALNSVSLIGEAVGGWETDVEFVYNDRQKAWTTVANVVKGKEYKIRFNKAWELEGKNCSLGGNADDLQLAGGNLTADVEGVTGFTLTLTDYPYHITTGEIKEDDTKLYAAYAVGGAWNYAAAPALQQQMAEDAPVQKFVGLLSLPTDAADPQVVLARIPSEMGTRYGGSADKLETYAAGVEARGMAVEAGLNYIHADLSEGAMLMKHFRVTSVSAVGGFNEWNAAEGLQFKETAPGKWTASHVFDADGEFKFVLNNNWTTTVGGVELQTSLGGHAADLRINGGNMVITKGEHTFELNLSSSPMTLAIDGRVGDLQLAPEFVEITGAFAHHVWNTVPEVASPKLMPAGKTETGGDRFLGFIDMYQPEGSTAADAEFKVTYPGWSSWLGGALQAETSYVFDIAKDMSDNMHIPFGCYGWEVIITDGMLQKGTARATLLERVGVIGDATPQGWDGDTEMTYDAEAHVYKINIELKKGEIKVRFNGGWDLNLGGDPANLTPGGANIPVEAGNYELVLDLVHTPNTLAINKK